jgi:hypothetical protein
VRRKPTRGYSYRGRRVKNVWPLQPPSPFESLASQYVLIASIDADWHERNIRLRGRVLSESISRLCIILASSNCEVFPCLAFVRPYFVSLSWALSGEVETRRFRRRDLPTWPTQIFRHVSEPLGFEGYSNLYHPAAFGVDSILNPSLAGISLCHDLDILQDESVLQVYMKDSHLVMYMKEQYKAEIRAQFRTFDATAIIVRGWSLVLLSVPDPYAEALWEGSNCALTWVLENDIVPLLSVLGDDNEGYKLLQTM